jgi:tetratricopeptide (TPR) repeat protein
MNSDDVIGLLKKAKVVEAIKASDSVEDKKDMASKLTEFAGTLNHLKGKNIICEVILKKSLELDPENHITHYNLGVLYSSPDVLEGGEHFVRFAIKHYLQCLSIRHDYHFARYNLALLYFFTGEKEKARREYQKILDAVGDDRRFREMGMMFLEDERIRNSQA